MAALTKDSTAGIGEAQESDSPNTRQQRKQDGYRKISYLSCSLCCSDSEEAILDLRDLFQWERFITPSIIKIFYWLAVGMSVLAGVLCVFFGLFVDAGESVHRGVIIVGRPIARLIRL